VQKKLKHKLNKHDFCAALQCFSDRVVTALQKSLGTPNENAKYVLRIYKNKRYLTTLSDPPGG